MINTIEPRIGIIGYGYVGKSMHRFFKNNVVAIKDPFVDQETVKEFIYKEGISFEPTLNIKETFKDLDLTVVSVPTNEMETGEANVHILDETLIWLTKTALNTGKKPLVLIKSTTPPSFLERIKKHYTELRLVFSPEYMGESRYFTPFWKYPDPKEIKMHDFQIFGGSKKDTSVCVDIFMRLMGPHVKFYQTDIVTAGLTKYMENIFFATKVTFCNEFYDIAKAYGVDYNELRELWLLDSRVGPMHTAVFPQDRGFGGKCYPKDLKALVFDVSNNKGYMPFLLDKVIKANKKFRKIKCAE